MDAYLLHCPNPVVTMWLSQAAKATTMAGCCADPTMDAYLLHCLNHVAKTADRIKRNNARLEAAAKQEQANGQAGSARVEDLPRDQVRGCGGALRVFVQMHECSLARLYQAHARCTYVCMC